MGDPVLCVWSHCWLDLGTSKAACESHRGPQGPCRKTLPAVVEGGCGEMHGGDSGELSVSQEGQWGKPWVSRNLEAERRCSKRDGEGRGKRSSCRYDRDPDNWVTVGLTLRWACFGGHTHCCGIQNNLSGLLEALMSWHPEFLYFQSVFPIALPALGQIPFVCIPWRLSWWLSGKESPANAGDAGSVPGSERSPGEGNGNLLLLPGKSHGQRSLVGSIGSQKSPTRLSDWTTTKTNIPYNLKKAETKIYFAGFVWKLIRTIHRK